jgi:hypothetical protein
MRAYEADPKGSRMVDASSISDSSRSKTSRSVGRTRRVEPAESVEIRLEASTMALYVSIVLLATLAAIDDTSDPSDVRLLEVIWGTTLGLALAHFFAFRISSRLVRGSSFHRHDVRIACAQLGGAVGVALLCSIPVVLLAPHSENDVTRLLLALLLGVAGYAAGRSGAASRPRSLLMGGVALVIGISVALIKNALVGH